LIAKILEAAGETVHLVGNIGTPSLDVLPNIKATDFVVHEISSFQLWDLTKSPHVAVVLMIEADHLDVHKDMEEYVAAKAQIAAHQTDSDFLYHHPTNKYALQIAERGSATKQPYLSAQNAYVDEGLIYLNGQEVCRADEVGLVGKHNLENICAALAAVSNFVDDYDAIKKALIEFKGLENRLEFVKQVDGVDYYNDTFSAAPMSAKAAVEAFDKPEILILGGFDKGADFSDLAKTIAQKNLKQVLLIGQIKNKLKADLDAAGFDNYQLVEGDMTDIVALAKSLATPGDVVLLSPGTSSFDMFKDYKDRGQKFKQAVQAL
jgi:UDP-N-acetylmuramoylalanine--D-glutamate ligase